MNLSRRRFLAISAAACAAPATAHTSEVVWRGKALGASASIVLAGEDAPAMRLLAGDVQAEIERLENIFSLYRPHSELSVLNRTGYLAGPAPDMLALMSLTSMVHDKSSGTFDPTVQTLWQLHARSTESRQPVDPAELSNALHRTGWEHVLYSPDAVRFERPGMALTFNGIAQGYVADRVAALLRSRGFSNVLIDMGEISAIGLRHDQKPWRVGIAAPDGTVLRKAELSDRAIATSAPGAMLLSAAGKVGHIIDPRSGKPESAWDIVSISDKRAVIADALSTSLCLLSKEEIARVLHNFPTANVELFGSKG